MKETVGFIGLGTMGAPMAHNITKAGFSLVVHDLNPKVAAPHLQEGAKWVENPRECAEAVDILITSLPGPTQCRTVMQGEHGALSGLSDGNLWIDMTTNSRTLLSTLATEAQQKGIRAIDAPVTGAVDGARTGTLTIFAGGETVDIERARPILETMGRVIACGAYGTGTVVKLVTNQLWFIHAAAIGEGLALGVKAGVEPLTLWQAIKDSVGDSFVARHDVPSIFAGHYDPSFTLDLCCKDLSLIEQLGTDKAVPLAMSLKAKERFELARETYGGQQGELHVAKLVEDEAQIELRAQGDWKPHWEV
ncbi:MAG: NAD(P)-dependent oxidoreductase [Gammaproteobacteria bacterium]|nr:NAD(P)-dependent oxidoreductase [Gammaproteobacteria bacterium]